MGKTRIRAIWWSLGISVLLAGAAYACIVPVYRYAMERWQPEFYDVLLVHMGELDTQTEKDLAVLTDSEANVQVFRVDIAGGVPKAYSNIMEEVDITTFPMVAVCYPAHYRYSRGIKVAWQGPATRAVFESIVDSPVRREIVRRLASGECGVWVLLRSGEKKKDDAAHALLTKQLALLEKELQFNEFLEAARKEAGIDLRIDFSVVDLNRNDPKEQVLVSALMGTEPGLHDYRSEPMAFAVFGRGRSFFGLVGEGINKDMITEVCAFLVGDCSCVIKEQNPGTDLIFDAQWETITDESLVAKVVDLPSLSLSAAATDPSVTHVPGPPPERRRAPPPATTSPIWLGVRATAAGIVLVLAALSLFVLRSSRRR